MISGLGNMPYGVNAYSGYSSSQNNFPTKTQETQQQFDKARNERVSQMKRMISGREQKQGNSILDSTLSYGKQLQQNRLNSKTAKTQVKQLQYNSKYISSQLVKSKTSVNAKQIASKARREVIKLKLKLSTGEYDTEELQAAITHAQAMERAAKKKARHLEEEEMIKVTEDEGNTSKAVDKSFLEDEMEQKLDEAYKEYDKMMENVISEYASEGGMHNISEDSIDMLSDEMISMISEAMEDTMEQALGDLADSMMMIPDSEMTENEFEVYKTKHRTSEEKAIMEADSNYLKDVFDRLDQLYSGQANFLA